MKKILILAVLIVCVSFAVSAQGLYFDIGLGLGKAWTEIDGEDVVDYFESLGIDVKQFTFDFGFKVGYGPFGRLPVYVVGELGGVTHKVFDSSAYMQFRTFVLGPGVLFYPIPLIQLGASVGFSFTKNETDIPLTVMFDSEKGFAWNISVAVDLGSGDNACLIGIKYLWAKNTLKTSKAEEKTTMIGVFVKYAYRSKVPSLFSN